MKCQNCAGKVRDDAEVCKYCGGNPRQAGSSQWLNEAPARERQEREKIAEDNRRYEAYMQEQRRNAAFAAAEKRRPLSAYGGKCPKCGGTNFKLRQSTGRKVAIGFGSALLKPNMLDCITCGHRLPRG